MSVITNHRQRDILRTVLPGETEGATAISERYQHLGIAGGKGGYKAAVLSGRTAPESTVVLAGAVLQEYCIRALFGTVYTGSTAPAADRVLSFTDGDGGAVIGEVYIPSVLTASWEWTLFFEPVAVLTQANGLFAVLDGALGTDGFYLRMVPSGTSERRYKTWVTMLRRPNSRIGSPTISRFRTLRTRRVRAT